MRYRVISIGHLFNNPEETEWDCNYTDSKFGAEYIISIPDGEPDPTNLRERFLTSDINIAYSYRARMQEIWPSGKFEVKPYEI